MITNSKHTLWVEKYRPNNIDNYVGHTNLISDIKSYIEKNDIPHLLLYGPPGTGKTTLSKIITSNIDCDYLYINASDENGIDVIRDKVKGFASSATFRGIKIIILDEADRLTPAGQDALRNIIETFSLKTRFILTCNYIERIIEPLRSRFQQGLYSIDSLPKKDIAAIVCNILDSENISFDIKDLAILVNNFYPDIRKIIGACQRYSKNGVLKLDTMNVLSSSIMDDIYTKIIKPNSKSWAEIRQIIADNDIKEFESIYKYLYDKLNNPIDTIIIAEHMYQHAFVIDKEITFMAAINKLITNYEQS